MNKALHVFVYLFLIGVGAALWYEYQLNDKRTELKDRNRMMEDYLVSKVAPLVEVGNDYEAEQNATIEMDDDDPTDPAKIEPTMKDLLEEIREYNASYEKIDHNLLSWGEVERGKLREIYILDEEGKPKMDGADKLTRGSKEDLVLADLVKALTSQKDQLKKTREAIPPLREKIKEVAEAYNKVTPQLRANIATNIQQKAQIEDLTKKNTKLEDEKTELSSQLKDKELEIASLRDEVVAAKNETDEVKENLDKQTKLAENYKKQIQQLIQQAQVATRGTATERGAIQSLPFGDKGKILRADNEYMFTIVEFTDEAMKQLKGNDLSQPLPVLELGVKRPGFEGPAGEFVGRIRLRQEVLGKNYVTCDILSNWSQGEDGLKPGDVVFAE